MAVVLLSALAAEPPVVQARFIGNSAFELSDGKSTILVDFPYESGAFGYMRFAADEARFRDNALCLFTHRHADHFDPGAIPAVGCSVAGPDEVQSAVPEALRLGPGPVWRFGAARIRCIPTTHAAVEHCSYLVSWHDAEIFISGDIETLDALDRAEHSTRTFFLPSWLASDVDCGSFASPAQVVIHHHRLDEQVSGRCFLVPSQGGTFAIAGAPPGNEP